MRFASFGRNGPLIEFEDYIAQMGGNPTNRRTLPFCPLCRRELHTYGAHSVRVAGRFDHPDNSQNCPWSSTADPRYRRLRPAIVDLSQAPFLRQQCLSNSNLAAIYQVCLELCGRGNLPMPTFRGLLQEADQRNIWAYGGMPVWTVPYILLTLEDLVGVRRDGGQYSFRFVLRKRSGHVDDLWMTTDQCRLEKVFANGTRMNMNGNPFEISAAAYATLSQATHWITQTHLRNLRP